MSPAFPARRRADEFHRLLEGTAPRSSAADDLAGFAALADDLRAVPPVLPRSEFSTALRERLMSAAATELAPAPTSTSAAVVDRLSVGRSGRALVGGRSQRRLTTALAALAVVGGSVGAAYAAQAALPGDTLYPVKRAIESADVTFSDDSHDRASALYTDADRRLDELDALTRRPQVDSGQVTGTLSTFRSQATRASDLMFRDFATTGDRTSIERVREFAAAGVRSLNELESRLPAASHPALEKAARSLLSIDDSARRTCAGCGGEGVQEMPPSLVRDSSSPSLFGRPSSTFFGAAAPHHAVTPRSGQSHGSTSVGTASHRDGDGDAGSGAIGSGTRSPGLPGLSGLTPSGSTSTPSGPKLFSGGTKHHALGDAPDLLSPDSGSSSQQDPTEDAKKFATGVQKTLSGVLDGLS